jgi:VWFA-related protein
MAYRPVDPTGVRLKRPRVLLALMLAIGTALSAQQPAAPPEEQPLPRFRAGANLVRVDAYVSEEGRPLTDLTADDFEVLEDDTPQQIETFELVRAHEATGDTVSAPATPASTREQQEAAQDPAARLFVLYLDRWHVGLDGSARSAAPVEAFLDKVVGQNDLVGVMTPDITPQNMTLIRKGTGIDRVLRDVWYWGERDRQNSSDPREEEIKACYPDSGATAGIAQEMIERRREQQTLRSIDALIGHLDGVRDERKFVLLLSEGWVQFRRSDNLGRPLGGTPPGGPDSVGVGPEGRLTTGVRQEGMNGGAGYEGCERERVMLAYIDHELEVRQMAQRANRANASFYPLDPRGLVAFDANPVATRRFDPEQDRARLASRQDGLKVLAEQTDGAWILNTSDTAGAIERILADTGSYYLLSYYSSNPKLDGRFRRITVRVRREGADIRHRMGYLAPTESEARSAGAAIDRVTGALGLKTSVPAAVTRALGTINAPTRGTVPLRVQATGLATRIRAIIELDAATAKMPEWQMGGTLQVSIEPERGGDPVVTTVPLPAGQRTVVFDGPNGDLAPGRYFVRLEGRPQRGTAGVRAVTDATVGAAGATIAASLVVLRRGPTTGLAYQPTADPRFRRTERIRAEVPILAEGAVTGAGRILTREGQPLPLQVVIGERADERSGARFLVAEVVLAPLAQGDYVLEIKAGRDAATYGFRIVP